MPVKNNFEAIRTGHSLLVVVVEILDVEVVTVVDFCTNVDVVSVVDFCLNVVVAKVQSEYNAF